jgi:hypothetical protein
MWTQIVLPKDVKKVAGFSFFFALVVWLTGQGGSGIDGIKL